MTRVHENRNETVSNIYVCYYVVEHIQTVFMCPSRIESLSKMHLHVRCSNVYIWSIFYHHRWAIVLGLFIDFFFVLCMLIRFLQNNNKIFSRQWRRSCFGSALNWIISNWPNSTIQAIFIHLDSWRYILQSFFFYFLFIRKWNGMKRNV